MSVQITPESVLESANEIMNYDNYLPRLNRTVIIGETSCKLKKTLVKFLTMQTIVDNDISISTESCNCLKSEFNFTQEC